MASYNVLIKPSALKEIEAIPRQADRRRIVNRIAALASDPLPPQCTKLSGHPYYRLRQRVYRIVYSVDDGNVVVIVVKVGHRKGVYRGIR